MCIESLLHGRHRLGAVGDTKVRARWQTLKPSPCRAEKSTALKDAKISAEYKGGSTIPTKDAVAVQPSGDRGSPLRSKC